MDAEGDSYFRCFVRDPETEPVDPEDSLDMVDAWSWASGAPRNIYTKASRTQLPLHVARQTLFFAIFNIFLPAKKI